MAASSFRDYANEISSLRLKTPTTTDIRYTIYATELSVLGGVNHFRKTKEIRALALKVLARSRYQPAVDLMQSRPDFVRKTTEAEKQVANIVASNEYRESVAPPVEREVVTITTIVTIVREAGEITVTSETITKSNSPISDSRERLQAMIAASEPAAQGLIREKMDVDTGVLKSNNERAFKREYNSRVRLAAFIDGYKDGALIERKERMKGFKIGTKYGVPKYDLVQMGVILFVTEAPSITLYESHDGVERTQLFSEIDISEEVRKATEMLDLYIVNWDLFTPEIVEMALQLTRKID